MCVCVRDCLSLRVIMFMVVVRLRVLSRWLHIIVRLRSVQISGNSCGVGVRQVSAMRDCFVLLRNKASRVATHSAHDYIGIGSGEIKYGHRRRVGHCVFFVVV